MFSPNHYEQIGVKILEEVNRMSHEDFDRVEKTKRKSSMLKDAVNWLVQRFSRHENESLSTDAEVSIQSPSISC